MTPRSGSEIGGRAAFESPPPELHFGLFGCPPNTGNRGVDALRLSVIGGLARAHPDRIRASVFDYGRGRRKSDEIPGVPISVEQVGAYYSRRYARTSNLQQMAWALKLRADRFHPTLRHLRRQNAVLDISGGDSFTDIYGERRFKGATSGKQVTLGAKVPLLLLPQTYGPFRFGESARVAAEILHGAARVWARDARSLEIVSELLGDDFDPERHREAADVAFALESTAPGQPFQDEVLTFRERHPLVVALNVSGLLFNVPGHAQTHFGFIDEYGELIKSLIRVLFDLGDLGLILVPHVESTYKHDCDATAIDSLVAELLPGQRERVLAPPRGLNARELKWVIGQADWACATRMHAAIAAISQGVPAVAIAYSDKTRGVFESVGSAGSVVDPRTAPQGLLLEQILDGFDQRAERSHDLQQRLPDVRAQVDRVFHDVISSVG